MFCWEKLLNQSYFGQKYSIVDSIYFTAYFKKVDVVLRKVQKNKLFYSDKGNY